MTTKIFSKKIISTIIFLLIAASVFFYFHHHAHTTSTPPSLPPIHVHAEKPVIKTLPITVTATGYLVAEKSTMITPLASGYIKTIEFHEGDAVQEKQILFQLDQATQKNAVESAKVNSELSALQFKREAMLLKRGFITQDAYHEAEVVAKQNQAALQTAETNLADRSIIAPFSGTVGAQSVSLGDYVNPGNTLTTLVNYKHLRLEYTLPVKYLSQLHLNQPVTITDAANKNIVEAVVTYIAPAVDQSTQTVAVHATIDNVKNLLKPGEYVTLTQTLGASQNQLLIPEQSLQASLEGYSVFLAKNNEAILQSVTPGEHVGDLVVITSGLSKEDWVISAGKDILKNHQAINSATMAD